MAEIDVKKKMVEENGQRMWDLALGTIFFSVDFSHVQTSGDKLAGNTCLKIAQSGQRLDHGYSVDGRSR